MLTEFQLYHVKRAGSENENVLLTLWNACVQHDGTHGNAYRDTPEYLLGGQEERMQGNAV